MKRFIFFPALLLALALAAPIAEAAPFELGLAVTPTFVGDTRYEAFSKGDLSLARFGVDARFEAGEVERFEFLPMIGYRFGLDSGNPYGILDTELALHDLAVGLRVRRELLCWLAVFVEAEAGILWAALDAAQDKDLAVGSGDLGARQDYKDRAMTWSAGGLAGLELSIPKRWLTARGVEKFGFGGEIGAGYLGRGDIRIAPEIERGIDNAIPAETAAWGDLNLSGWFLQLGVSFRFF